MSKASTSPMPKTPPLTRAQTLAQAQEFTQTNFFPNLRLASREPTTDESAKRTARLLRNARRPDTLHHPLLSQHLLQTITQALDSIPVTTHPSQLSTSLLISNPMHTHPPCSTLADLLRPARGFYSSKKYSDL